ncbi:ATP-dependent zinc protease family protein [Hymenobacter sp. HD11105]
MIKKQVSKRVVGRRELVDFPQFQLRGVEAKVDTGAYTGAIHCSNIHVETLPDGREMLRVLLLDPSHPNFDGQPLEFENFLLRDIKSSNGEVQERYVIQTVIQLFGEDIPAEFSLSDRSDMRYPVLIGRSLLRQAQLVVDVARLHLSYKSQRVAKHPRPSID